MADINRRFSRAQWSQPDPSSGILPPSATTLRYNNNNATGSSLNVDEYYNRSNPQLNSNYIANGAPSIRSVDTSATNATSATTRRRFSVKLNQPPPLDGYNTFKAPPLPLNAQAQILNNQSFTNASDMLSVQSEDNNMHDISMIPSEKEMMSRSELNLNQRSPHKQQAGLLNELSSETFDAARFVQMQLGDANASKIDDFSNQLDALNTATDDAVKFSLSESTNQVLAVGDAFKQTYDVLMTLKPAVNDLSDVISQQLEEAQDFFDRNVSQNGSQGNTASRVNRQSVLLLQNKWTSAMKKLYAKIEKAHDLLPPVPTRHIIIESRRWGELNSITGKPVRPAHIVVFNDAILIASRTKQNKQKASGGDADSGKNIRNVATYCWMVDKITAQKGSANRGINELLNQSWHGNDANIPSSSTSNTAASNTLCLKTIDSSQTFLFQTDQASEFLKVFSAIKQAKAESSNAKRNSVKESITKLGLNRPESAHVSLGQNITTTNIEKQIEPEFNTLVSLIDDLITSSSLELGLHRFDNCVGYLTRLEEELKNLASVGHALGIPQALLTSKSFTSIKKSNYQPSVFSQQVHMVYNMKLADVKVLKGQLVDSVLLEVASPMNDISKVQNAIDVCRLLNKDKEAADVFLDARSKFLEDCVSSVRVGSGNGGHSAATMGVFQSVGTSPQNGGSLSRSNSSRALSSLSRPTSVGNTPEPEGFDNSPNPVSDNIGSVTGKLITAYVKELSLVYMGSITRVWEEWNKLFLVPVQTSSTSSTKGKSDHLTNIRIIEWVNENILEMRSMLISALSDYDKNGEVFTSSVSIVKDIFEGLKEKELNVDYLLEM